MKVRFIRRIQQHNPEFVKDEYEASVRANRPYIKDSKVVPPTVWREAGYVHELPDAWQLCECGEALPVDDEAKAMCVSLGITDDDIMARHRALVAFENTEYDPDTGLPVEPEDIEEEAA